MIDAFVALGRGQEQLASCNLVTEQCCACQMLFAMPADLKRRLRNNHESFYCPAGHKQHYTGETDADQLRRERDRLKQSLAERDDRIGRLTEQRDEAHRSASAFKGVATRIRRRVKNGVCPCCTRSFSNLAAHMATKHPTFTAEAVAP
jgi:hypothetical protein